MDAEDAKRCHRKMRNNTEGYSEREAKSEKTRRERRYGKKLRK